MLPNAPAGASGVSDADLLSRFVSHQDEAAFELLVWRHGPLVLGACRRILRRDQDIEDAFQATFLTLARKAGSISKGASVSAWLYQVAYRVALRVNRYRAPQPLGNQDLVFTADGDPGEQLAAHELRSLLDAEVNRLPEKYRTAFILCYLNGKTNEAAARELGCPKGTILSRLARARDRLRRRLTEKGFGDGLLSDVLSDQARNLPSLAPVMVHTMIQLAVLTPAARLAARKSVVELADSVMQQMRLITVQKMAGRVVLMSLLLAVVAAVLWVATPTSDGSSAVPHSTDSPPPAVSCHPR
jgi:RNA polymerase sigma factor (sigma-70 family)